MKKKLGGLHRSPDLAGGISFPAANVETRRGARNTFRRTRENATMADLGFGVAKRPRGGERPATYLFSFQDQKGAM